MAGIKGKNTRPEIILRSELHKRGFRFRLHSRKLPGKPDLVLRKYNAVIFANGCFWHGHDCHLFKWPSTREEFWRTKINRNKEVDIRNIENLQSTGWRIAIIWECALKGKTRLSLDDMINRCTGWLRSAQKFIEIEGTE